MLQGYAVYDETGTIIPMTLTATFMVENVEVPVTMRDAAIRFLEHNPQYFANWERAVKDGYTVRRVTIKVDEVKA